jgi:hypothetical protein
MEEREGVGKRKKEKYFLFPMQEMGAKIPPSPFCFSYFLGSISHFLPRFSASQRARIIDLSQRTWPPIILYP